MKVWNNLGMVFRILREYFCKKNYSNTYFEYYLSLMLLILNTFQKYFSRVWCPRTRLPVRGGRGGIVNTVYTSQQPQCSGATKIYINSTLDSATLAETPRKTTIHFLRNYTYQTLSSYEIKH